VIVNGPVVKWQRRSAQTGEILWVRFPLGLLALVPPYGSVRNGEVGGVSHSKRIPWDRNRDETPLTKPKLL
jgi:hypothetical protein